jgi:hypothetical protein
MFHIFALISNVEGSVMCDYIPSGMVGVSVGVLLSH